MRHLSVVFRLEQKTIEFLAKDYERPKAARSQKTQANTASMQPNGSNARSSIMDVIHTNSDRSGFLEDHKRGPVRAERSPRGS